MYNFHETISFFYLCLVSISIQMNEYINNNEILLPNSYRVNVADHTRLIDFVKARNKSTRID